MDILGTALGALIGGVPTIIAVILSNRSHDKVVDEKISELTKKVEKHNNLIERTAKLEQSMDMAWKSIDGLERKR